MALAALSEAPMVTADRRFAAAVGRHDQLATVVMLAGRFGLTF
jgi:hypothetical protein